MVAARREPGEGRHGVILNRTALAITTCRHMYWNDRIVTHWLDGPWAPGGHGSILPLYRDGHGEVRYVH